MGSAPTAPAICDRGDCPALAQHLVVLHGQDFYFCGHHAVELTRALAALAAPGAPHRIVEASGAAPHERPARDRLLASGQPT